MKKLAFAISSLGLLPMFAFAQGTNLTGLLTLIETLIGTIIPLLIAVAVIFFFWELIGYIKSAGGDDKNEKLKGIGKALLAIFIMLAFMGIIRVLGNTIFGQGQGVGDGIGSGDIPTIAL